MSKLCFLKETLCFDSTFMWSQLKNKIILKAKETLYLRLTHCQLHINASAAFETIYYQHEDVSVVSGCIQAFMHPPLYRRTLVWNSHWQSESISNYKPHIMVLLQANGKRPSLPPYTKGSITPCRLFLHPSFACCSRNGPSLWKSITIFCLKVSSFQKTEICLASVHHSA